MVAKMIRRTPIKSIKDLRNSNRGRKRSTIKNNASLTSAASVVATINKSIYTCRRRLIKIFSKFARTGTPRRSPRKRGYQILKKTPTDDTQTRNLQRPLFNADDESLPTSSPLKKKTVFLDLDETLVHSNIDGPPEKYDFIIRPLIDGQRIIFYVSKRPFVEEFLEALSKKFDIVVFTAGLEEYASLVVNRIDQRSVISHRLYRNSCKEVDGKFVKDLSILGRDLKSVAIVDDNPNSYTFQPENGIPIRPFTGDLEDKELPRLIKFFENSEDCGDLRQAIRDFLAAEGDKVVEI